MLAIEMIVQNSRQSENFRDRLLYHLLIRMMQNFGGFYDSMNSDKRVNSLYIIQYCMFIRNKEPLDLGSPKIL